MPILEIRCNETFYDSLWALLSYTSSEPAYVVLCRAARLHWTEQPSIATASLYLKIATRFSCPLANSLLVLDPGKFGALLKGKPFF